MLKFFWQKKLGEGGHVIVCITFIHPSDIFSILCTGQLSTTVAPCARASWMCTALPMAASTRPAIGS